MVTNVYEFKKRGGKLSAKHTLKNMIIGDETVKTGYFIRQKV